jgi:DNA transformation protein and related proteins
MPVTPTFRTFVLEQLRRVVPAVRDKSMFGGVGVYSADCYFALMDDDVVYFKVDDTNRPDFEARGMGPFRPFGPGGEAMQYYEVPEDLLEDADALGAWAERAIAVARRARERKPKARPTSRKPKTRPKPKAKPKAKPRRRS